MPDLGDFYAFKMTSSGSGSGGGKNNAIPREAQIEFVIEEDKIYNFINEIKFLSEKYKNE